MAVNDISASVNALACAGVVVMLMLYRRRDAQHRTGVSWLAWFITVSYGAVPLAYLCGIYPHSSWLTVAANIIVFAILARAGGNVARLLDSLRH